MQQLLRRCGLTQQRRKVGEIGPHEWWLSDLAVAGNQQFQSCIKNELVRSTPGVGPRGSLIEPLRKPSVGDQALGFRVDVGGNLFYDLFAVQQGRAVLFFQGIGIGRPLDLALELNALGAMSARLPGNL